MTVHIVAIGDTSITIVSESLGQELDSVGRATGVILDVTKCSLLPKAPALLAGRGVIGLLHSLASVCMSEMFDGIVQAMPNRLRTIIEQHKVHMPLKSDRFDETEIILAGFSTVRQQFEAYLLVAHGKYPGGVQPFEMHKINKPLFALPWSDPDMERLNKACPQACDFDPAIHSAVYYDSITPEMASINEPIGGRIQISTVERDGVAARWIDHDWPTNLSPSDKVAAMMP